MGNNIKDDIKALFNIQNMVLLIGICIVVALTVMLDRNTNLKRDNTPVKFDLSEEVIEICIKRHLHYQKDCGHCRCIIPVLTDEGKPIKCYNEIGEK